MNLRDAKALTEAYLEHFGLNGWRFEFDRSIKRFGACFHLQKKITLSERLVLANSENIVEQTILHEIAHALVGEGHGHDWVWQAKARELGCSGNRCYGDEVTRAESRYLAVCPNCQASIPKNRKPTKLYACTPCCKKHNNGKYHPNFQFKLVPNPVFV